MSPISSRNSEPPSACSKRPRRRLSAPVNEPFSWPNSSDSSSSAGIAEVLSAMKGFLRARTVLVQRARHQLLAGARLARDQHVDAGLRQPPDGAEHLLHGAGASEQRQHGAAAAGLARGLVARVRGAPYQVDGMVDVEGLGQVFEGAALVGRDRGAKVRVRGHHDYRQFRVARVHALQQVDARLPGHAHVRDQHVGRTCAQCCQHRLRCFERCC